MLLAIQEQRLPSGLRYIISKLYNNAGCVFLRGIKEEQRNFDQALEHLTIAYNEHPNSMSCHNLGLVMLQKGDVEKARELFQRAYLIEQTKDITKSLQASMEATIETASSIAMNINCIIYI